MASVRSAANPPAKASTPIRMYMAIAAMYAASPS
jgi:hypothetical protein